MKTKRKPNYIWYPQLQDRAWLEKEIQTKSMREIAEEIGCSTSAVEFAVVNRFSMAMPKHPGRAQPKLIRFPKLHDVEWLRSAIAERSIHKIAEEVGCSYGAVISVLRKYGVGVPQRTKESIFRENLPREKARLNAGAYGFGPQSRHWKGGRIDAPSFKYVWIYQPEHPYANAKGYVLEHRLVMEKKLGRYLLPGEKVHHKNNNGKDNTPDNLEMFKTNKEHFQRHFDAVRREGKLENRIVELEAELKAARAGQS